MRIFTPNVLQDLRLLSMLNGPQHFMPSFPCGNLSGKQPKTYHITDWVKPEHSPRVNHIRQIDLRELKIVLGREY